MGRRIVSTQPQVAMAGGKTDGYFDRIIKYIPSDVVGAWIAVTGIIGGPTAENNSYPMLWAAFAFGVVFTFAWTWRQTSGAATQCAVATLAFAVWAFALGGPFQAFPWYEGKLGSIVLIGFTLLTGLLVPRET